MLGLFQENGPYVVYPNLTVGQRPVAWTDKYSVLYVDNPVGTGFSYTDNRTACYAHSVDQVVDGVYTFLRSFFGYFSHLKSNPFIVTGESYAGKYVPALANYIVTHPESKKYFNFKGMAVGNGWTDPINQIDVASLLYQIGLVDDLERDKMIKVQNNITRLIKQSEH